MPPTAVTAELITGQKMDLEEFIRRWEDQLELKFAELIDGVVHVPSPLSSDHSRPDRRIGWWLTEYADATPGCEAGSKASWYMLDSMPQPDCYLRILPEKGGQSSNKATNTGTYCAGAPELIVDVCVSSKQVDFGPKLELYQKAGVREYITIEVLRRRILGRVLEQKRYANLPAHVDGSFRSQVFPGLWLDIAALWVDDGPKMKATLLAGLATTDHARFAARLVGTE